MSDANVHTLVLYSSVCFFFLVGNHFVGWAVNFVQKLLQPFYRSEISFRWYALNSLFFSILKGKRKLQKIWVKTVKCDLFFSNYVEFLTIELMKYWKLFSSCVLFILVSVIDVFYKIYQQLIVLFFWTKRFTTFYSFSATSFVVIGLSK